MSKNPVKSAGIRTGKDLPQGRKPFGGAGDKAGPAGKGLIGGAGNGPNSKNWRKGKGS